MSLMSAPTTTAGSGMAPIRSAQNCDLTSASRSERVMSLMAGAPRRALTLKEARAQRSQVARPGGRASSLFAQVARGLDRFAQRAPPPDRLMRAEQRHREDERRQVINGAKQQQRSENRAAFGGDGLQHRRVEDAEPARRMAGDSQHAGEGIERAEGHEG